MSLVSIVTPTMPGREPLLLERCIPSVAGLHPKMPGQHRLAGVEHVIVSDPNPDLAEQFRMRSHPDDEPDIAHSLDGRRTSLVRFVQLNDTWRDGVREKSVGAVPWMVGSLLAQGDYVGFLGDDDEILPDHVARHVEVMEATGADFTVSPVEFRVDGAPRQIIGGQQFAHGHLDAIGIMCRRETLRTANWTATGEDAADWRLVDDWLRAGLKGEMVPGPPTAIHNDGWMAR